MRLQTDVGSWLSRGLVAAALASAPMYVVLPTTAVELAPPAAVMRPASLPSSFALADYAEAQAAKKEAAAAAKAEARAAQAAATKAKIAAAAVGDKSKPVKCVNFGQASGTCDAIEIGVAASLPTLSFDEKFALARENPDDERVKDLKLNEMSAKKQEQLEKQAAAAAKQVPSAPPLQESNGLLPPPFPPPAVYFCSPIVPACAIALLPESRERPTRLSRPRRPPS